MEVRKSDLFLHADEIMKARLVRDEILSGHKAEDALDEVFVDLDEALDASGRSKLYLLALQWPSPCDSQVLPHSPPAESRPNGRRCFGILIAFPSAFA